MTPKGGLKGALFFTSASSMARYLILKNCNRVYTLSPHGTEVISDVGWGPSSIASVMRMNVNIILLTSSPVSENDYRHRLNFNHEGGGAVEK